MVTTINDLFGRQVQCEGPVCGLSVYSAFTHSLYSGSLGGNREANNPMDPPHTASLQRPPHIVLTLLEGNPTSSTSHCCSVQTANKGGPKGQRSWQTLLTVPPLKNLHCLSPRQLSTPRHTHLDNQKAQASAPGRGLFLPQNKICPAEELLSPFVFVVGEITIAEVHVLYGGRMKGRRHVSN